MESKSNQANYGTYTISGDKTNDSEFERNSEILTAAREKPDTDMTDTDMTDTVSSDDGEHPTLPDDFLSDPHRPIFQSFSPSVLIQGTDPRSPNNYSSGNDLYSRMLIPNHDMREHDTTNVQQVAGGIRHTRKSSRRPPTVSIETLNDHQSIMDEFGIPMESATRLGAYLSRLQQPRIYSTKDLRPQIIYRVHSRDEESDPQMYLDRPQWVDGVHEKNEVLMGNLPIRDIASYLERNPEVCFIVYRNFPDPSTMKKYQNDAISNPTHTSEVIETASTILDTALTEFMDSSGFNADILEGAKRTTSQDSNADDDDFLSAPYPAFYHTQGEAMDTFLKSLDRPHQQHFRVLLDYILPQYEREYDTAKEMTSNGRIRQQYLIYLFKPGDIVVRKDGDRVSAFLCGSWLVEEPPRGNKRKVGKEPAVVRYTMEARHWTFDGAFSCEETTLDMEMSVDNTSDLEIDGLKFYPLSYDKGDLANKLRHRGEMVWKCRTRCLVSYHEDITRDLHNASDDRYMIDMATYNRLHKNQKDHSTASLPSSRQLGSVSLSPEAMERDDHPSDTFLYLLPTTMKGFNLRNKKWLDLNVDYMGDVVWNTKAFESLVLEKNTKELIQALVSNQTETEKSTDLISGKGNGLILLLHGGPGTGKTLTAESVAEIAQKPLYPVTCGDIGTEPEAVEKYLESVLYLGKIWGCVVLLDEADVFLEQRSLEDLRRNALVSVFLRVLEYYEGILILTSNRVGTFDEAFKSRIQLSIHYKNLEYDDRVKIWGNFIDRLRELKEDGIDFNDLDQKIMRLANYAMNGREIRNVITLARQYTQWKRMHQNTERCKLNFEEISSIIKTTSKFDQYIKKLNGGHSADEIAEDEGWRLADETN